MTCRVFSSPRLQAKIECNTAGDNAGAINDQHGEVCKILTHTWFSYKIIQRSPSQGKRGSIPFYHLMALYNKWGLFNTVLGKKCCCVQWLKSNCVTVCLNTSWGYLWNHREVTVLSIVFSYSDYVKKERGGRFLRMRIKHLLASKIPSRRKI